MSQPHEASLRSDGGVQLGPPLTTAAAVSRRQAGLDVIVCGPDKADNRTEAYAIETAANGPCQRHNYHRGTGTLGLPHFQPIDRPPSGHTFYEVDKRKAVAKP